MMAVSKTTNFGASWTRYNVGVDTGLTRCLAIDPENSNIVYAGGNEGSACAIYKTADGGGIWVKCSASGLVDSCVYGIAIDPDNPTIIYAGTAAGCYKSTDGGSSFAATSCPGGHTNTVLVNSGSAIYEGVYVGTKTNGVYWSTNGGSSWTQINDGLINLSVNCLSLSENTYVYAGTQGGGIYRWSIAVGSEEQTADRTPFCLLYANPNPFRQYTLFHYDLMRDSEVNISVFDIQGRLISTLIDGRQSAGRHDVRWNACTGSEPEIPAGVYFCRLTADGRTSVYKVILMR